VADALCVVRSAVLLEKAKIDVVHVGRIPNDLALWIDQDAAAAWPDRRSIGAGARRPVSKSRGLQIERLRAFRRHWFFADLFAVISAS